VPSTRPDLIHPAYAQALERIQDTCAEVPFAVIRETVESELQSRFTKLFDTVEETPVGVALLAQVHRTTLRDGRVVTDLLPQIGAPDSRKGAHAGGTGLRVSRGPGYLAALTRTRR
jgi:hypothetical protein